jgi:Cdc6-like AAA superfamily ATPase
MIEPRHELERVREIGRVVADLRTRFVKHKRYLRLAEEFDLLLYRRRAEIEGGLQSEARGLVVIGASGSGKTTAIRRLFAKHTDLHLPRPDVEQADVVSFLVPAPATLKSVGYDCLTSLGYPLNRDRTGAVIWSKVQTLLSERKVLFLHLDEVQHLYNLKANRESQAVVNTLKSLMQRPDWPTGLILSGTNELQSLVNMDPQLSRRLTPVEFPSIDATTHAREIKGIVSHYSEIAGLSVNAGELSSSNFARRLIHAAANELGLVIELIVAAIEDALLRTASELDKEAFARAFARRSGCSHVGNPILADDWRAIDARKLLDGAGSSLIGPGVEA